MKSLLERNIQAILLKRHEIEYSPTKSVRWKRHHFQQNGIVFRPRASALERYLIAQTSNI